jgi:feruloyl esterase
MKALEADPAARLGSSARELLHEAVLGACDGLDGSKDGLVENPAHCAFDPAVLECAGTETANCLSAAQVATARFIYASAANPRTGREIPGLARSSELGWTDLGWTEGARTTGLDHFRFIVFRNPAWEVRQFDFDNDIARAEEADAGAINALDPNLQPFFDRGGKLIQYHGWSDPQVASGASVQYHTRVVNALGGEETVRRSYRLFMIPGMAHCGGGEGPTAFDVAGALEDWVERGRPPDRIVAARSSQGAVAWTRPLCPFPQQAVYNGRGSATDAESFACDVRAPFGR